VSTGIQFSKTRKYRFNRFPRVVTYTRSTTRPLE
jgi:hypothetical protein